MKKLVFNVTLALSLLIASPTFAYEVKSGDTMTDIAERNNLSLDTIININPHITNVDMIFVGQEIRLQQEIDDAIYVTELVEEETIEVVVITEDVTNVTQNEKELLARLVRAEAQGEPFEGKVAVAEVVLNRVNSDKFPDSIKGVIYQKNQFSPVSNGSINKPYAEEDMRAVEEALANDSSLTLDALFFYNPKIATSRWLDTRQTTATIGNHVFKK